MFLKIICLYIASVCVFAAPPTDVVPLEKQQPTVIPIVAQSEELEANGTFKFSYETANGIKREETSYDKVLPKARNGVSKSGEDKNDESNEIHVQRGSYSYTAPDGTVITLRYIADENGFRPIGDHLPKPPTILVTASSDRISGRKAKTADNAESGSAPTAAIAALSNEKAPVTNGASKKLEAPKVELRIAESSSAEQASTTISESQDSITTTEVPSSTQGPSTAESSTSTTESASTTTESALTTTKQSSSSEVTSTEQPTTTEVASTSKPSSKTSNSDELTTSAAISTANATPAESSPSSETTTETATTVFV